MSEEPSLLFEIKQTTRSMRRLKPDRVPAALIRKSWKPPYPRLQAGTCSVGGFS